MNDNELMISVMQGNHEAFRELYDRYYEYAVRVSTVVLQNDTALALDVVQEAFIRLFRHASSFNPTQAFKPWFYTILINECKRMGAKHRKFVATSDDEMAVFDHGQDDKHAFELYEELYSELKRLEEHNRIPIILKYMHDLQEQEIADTLGENINTIKSRIYKAKQKLRIRMENTLGGGEG